MSAYRRNALLRSAGRAAVFSGLLAAAFSCVYPVLFMVVTSLKTLKAYRADPYGIALDAFVFLNYRTMLSQFSLALNFLNSLIIVVGALIGITALSLFGAYAFSRLRFPFKSALYLAILGSMFIPAQVTIIPSYVIFSRLGLVNHPLSVILSYIAGGIPGTLILFTAGFKAIPKELFESMKMDGAGYFRTVFRLVAPLGQATIAVGSITSFIGYWNDLLTPMVFLQTERSKTVMVALAGLVTRYSGDPTYRMAGMVLAMAPAFAVFFLFQKFIIRGLTVGAIK